MSASAELKERYGITLPTLRKMFREVVTDGTTSKSAAEAKYLGITSAHGKLATQLFEKYLGESTEKRHPLAVENERLRKVLKKHGITVDEMGHELAEAS